MEIDRLDLAILEVLQRDGRATAAELGEAAGLSASPSHRRQKMLEEAGVIQRYVALLDQEQVGLPINVFVTVRMADHADETLRVFERAVEACPEVMEMYEMSGAADFLMRVVAADVASYEAFLRGRLTKIPGVKSFESSLALKRVVYRTNLPLRAARGA
ncbi:MAG TPA: Lrp/AsnC family transcriptional regulator [Rhodopila sp.]|uniref:Lrp/AsnC family transcriptional regulator n=1 Tax=Rhodopila sp. TaxID=2480087 RepID=UPI002CA5B4B5|nr:Lrp/AsnC family transcriptional regulator [Rhodopila sp.]HVY14643.1 Lrp/AsnC family transcriptional regulator [Rhodopila sp.]